MSGITSVKFARKDPNRTLPILLSMIGGIILFFGLAEKSSDALVWGGLCALAGILILVGQKPDFLVVLHSASGELKALTSKNENFIQEVIEAINEAIVFRR